MMSEPIQLVPGMLKFDEMKQSHFIPGETFDAIAHDESMQGMYLYEAIVDNLIDKCFSPDVSPLRDTVLEVMPEMDTLLLQSNTQNRSLKIAVDIGKLAKINREQESRLIFEAALIVLLYIHIIRDTPMNNPPNVELFESYQEIAAIYGNLKEFSTYDILELEQKKLLFFSNIMKAALVLMSKPKKAHLLDLVTRISEGRLAKYITGSGQTILTARRVQIFQNESGVTPQPRPPRKPKELQTIEDISRYPASFPFPGYEYMSNYPMLAEAMSAKGIIPLPSVFSLTQTTLDPHIYDVIPISRESTVHSVAEEPSDHDVMEASRILSNLSSIMQSFAPASASAASDTIGQEQLASVAKKANARRSSDREEEEDCAIVNVPMSGGMNKDTTAPIKSEPARPYSPAGEGNPSKRSRYDSSVLNMMSGNYFNAVVGH